MHSIFAVVGVLFVLTAACTSHPLVRPAVQTSDGGDVIGIDPAKESEIDGAAMAEPDGSHDTKDATTVTDVPTRDGLSREAPDSAPLDSGSNTCLSQPTESLLLCDDFSNPTPPTPRVAYPWPGLTGMTVTLAPDTAVIQDPGQWSAAYVQWSRAMDFRDTSIEVDMTATTSDRSLSFVIWGVPPTYISLGLQRDENAMYLHVVVNDVIKNRISASASMAPNKTQRVKMELLASGQIRGIVDGVVSLNATIDLSPFPATLTPGIGADSYPSQRFTFDNLVVRKLMGN
jgi:hypothetical protein